MHQWKANNITLGGACAYCSPKKTNKKTTTTTTTTKKQRQKKKTEKKTKKRKKNNKKETNQQYPSIPLLPYFQSYFLSYYEQIFKIRFILCMYSVAIARLSHKPSWAGCISCRWHESYWLIDWLYVSRLTTLPWPIYTKRLDALPHC